MKSFLSLAAVVMGLWAWASAAALAQPGSGGPTPSATTAVPIDGGTSLLVAGGIGYAVRRLRRKR